MWKLHVTITTLAVKSQILHIFILLIQWTCSSKWPFGFQKPTAQRGNNTCSGSKWRHKAERNFRDSWPSMGIFSQHQASSVLQPKEWWSCYGMSWIFSVYILFLYNIVIQYIQLHIYISSARGFTLAVILLCGGTKPSSRIYFHRWESLRPLKIYQKSMELFWSLSMCGAQCSRLFVKHTETC